MVGWRQRQEWRGAGAAATATPIADIWLPPKLRISLLGNGQVQIIWPGAAILQSASQVAGPYDNVTNATTRYGDRNRRSISENFGGIIRSNDQAKIFRLAANASEATVPKAVIVKPRLIKKLKTGLPGVR